VDVEAGVEADGEAGAVVDVSAAQLVATSIDTRGTARATLIERLIG
jgi:hypothetical protein